MEGKLRSVCAAEKGELSLHFRTCHKETFLVTILKYILFFLYLRSKIAQNEKVRENFSFGLWEKL